MKTLIRYLGTALVVGVNGGLFAWADISSSTFCKGELDEVSLAAAAFIVAADLVIVWAMWSSARAVDGAS